MGQLSDPERNKAFIGTFTAPYQKANILVLLGLLAELPDENYDHSEFGFNAAYPNSGCALSLAVKNEDKFTIPDADLVLWDRQIFGPVACDLVFGVDAFGCDPHAVTKAQVVERLQRIVDKVE